MYGYLVQDWTTVMVNSALTTIVQSESDWLSLQPYQDVVFFLEVKSVIPNGAEVLLTYQTAPVKENSIFTPMVAALSMGANDIPVVTPVLLAENPLCPLATWVRWVISVEGAPVGDWGATFRIYCVANAVGPL